MQEIRRRVFVAFSIAAGGGLLIVFTGFGKPWLAPMPIVAYAAYLYARRDPDSGTLLPSFKDSPYFLGFILTMFGLFKVFNDLAFDFAAIAASPAAILREVGGAILTTVVGLVSREALLTLIPEGDDAVEGAAAGSADVERVLNAFSSQAVAMEMARRQFFEELQAEQRRRDAELREDRERFFRALTEMMRAARSGPTPPADDDAADDPDAVPIGALRRERRARGARPSEPGILRKQG